MSFWQKLKSGLGKTSKNISDGITTIFTHKKLDQHTLDLFEDLLIQTDMGVANANSLRAKLQKQRMHQEISEKEIKDWLADEITKILEPVASVIKINNNPEVILMIGVNGVGKTTTIAKLSNVWKQQNKKILWAAGDTFRAAAVEQLQVWGERLEIPVLTTKSGGDAAGLAFDALQKAKSENYDILCVDTAGRLQNKQHLMDELQKILKVMKKIDVNVPHRVMLVVDATTGQNVIEQVKTFKQIVGVTDLVITKLDGTAKGGIVVALAAQFKIPIVAVGVGESADDLKPFEASEFAKALVS
jgi:fused signal recognition particle receptor